MGRPSNDDWDRQYIVERLEDPVVYETLPPVELSPETIDWINSRLPKPGDDPEHLYHSAPGPGPLSFRLDPNDRISIRHAFDMKEPTIDEVWQIRLLIWAGYVAFGLLLWSAVLFSGGCASRHPEETPVVLEQPKENPPPLLPPSGKRWRMHMRPL